MSRVPSISPADISLGDTIESEGRIYMLVRRTEYLGDKFTLTWQGRSARKKATPKKGLSRMGKRILIPGKLRKKKGDVLEFHRP